VDGPIAQQHLAEYINIPLTVKFQTNEIGKGIKWYASAGLKMGIPLRGSYTTKGVITGTGRAETGGDLYTGMPQHGFGTHDYGAGTKSSFSFRNNLVFSFETGMKWRLTTTEKCFLYTGLFLDYGLSDLHSDDKNKLYEYNPHSPEYTPHSAFHSRHYNITTPYTGKVNSLAFGVKVQLAFGKKIFTMPKYPEKHSALTAPQAEQIIERNVDRIIVVQEEIKVVQEEIKDVINETIRNAATPDFTYSVSGFELNKSDIQPFMTPILEEVLKLLRRYPTIRVQIVGHTDDVGTNEKNELLGLRRAEVVKEYFESRGVIGTRLETSSSSSTNPILPNANDPSRRVNRRVDISPVDY
jgi:outer membrane protein OmpA-like peptidoglycan-associated protein